jgi:hypothetical protein
MPETVAKRVYQIQIEDMLRNTIVTAAPALA